MAFSLCSLRFEPLFSAGLRDLMNVAIPEIRVEISLGIRPFRTYPPRTSNHTNVHFLPLASLPSCQFAYFADSLGRSLVLRTRPAGARFGMDIVRGFYLKAGLQHNVVTSSEYDMGGDASGDRYGYLDEI